MDDFCKIPGEPSIVTWGFEGSKADPPPTPSYYGPHFHGGVVSGAQGPSLSKTLWALVHLSLSSDCEPPALRAHSPHLQPLGPGTSHRPGTRWVPQGHLRKAWLPSLASSPPSALHTCRKRSGRPGGRHTARGSEFLCWPHRLSFGKPLPLCLAVHCGMR